MSEKISRRVFLKKSTVIGAGTFIGGSVFTGFNAFAGVEKSKAGLDIAVVKGKTYFENTFKVVEMIGGIQEFVKKGSKVGIVINSPFKNPGTIVNSDIALAVVKMCKDAGASEICCIPNASDSYWEKSLLAEKYKTLIKDIKPAGDHIEISIPKGKSLKKASVAKGLLECDVFINMPISKDHNGTRFTGTLKNLMGACPYSTNKFFHYGSNAKKAYDDVEFLSQCIADLNLVKKPDLCVVDSTMFITTNGPFGPGKMTSPQKIVACRDRVLSDSYCCTLLGLKPQDVIMINRAHEHGLGNMNLEKAVIKEVSA
jgi:uncharacterized protein (DUF362 family)